MTNLFERVLFATDLSPASDKVFESLEDMDRMGLKAARLVYVLETSGAEGGSEDAAVWARQGLGKMAGRLARLGVVTDFLVRKGGPADVIVEEALDFQATLILMGSKMHGGLTRLLVGDTALEVIHKTKTPVLVERAPQIRKGGSPLERALVPLDFSEASEEVLDRLRGLAGGALKEAVLVHVVEPEFSGLAEAEQVSSAESFLDDIALGLRGAGAIASVHVHTGRAEKEIVGIALEEKATVIVMGSHFRGRIREALSGGTAERVLAHSPVSVLYFPHNEVSS